MTVILSARCGKGVDEMNHKSMSVSLIMLVLSLLLFTASSFAWFALSDAAKVDPFIVEVNEYEADIVFQISKNGGEPQTLITQSEIAQFLANSVPSDYFDFVITVENLSSTHVSASIYFNDILSTTSDNNYDMRDVFLITDGLLSVNASTNPIPQNDPTAVTKYGQLLSNYRLSNLIDGSNDFMIIQEINIPIGAKVFIQFGLTYHETTEHIAYQGGILTIGGLYVVFDT